MSERGSFVTEYIYCPKCLHVLQEVLISNDKFLMGIQIPSWNNSSLLPIIAGKIGGLHAGEELETMRDELAPLFQEALCHPVRIAVIPENGEATVFTFGPVP